MFTNRIDAKENIILLCGDAIDNFIQKTNISVAIKDDFINRIGTFWRDDFHLSDDYRFHTIKNYLKNTVVPHKSEVFNAGIDLGVALRNAGIDLKFKGGVNWEQYRENLLYHDMSKFGTEEHGGYAFYDFKVKRDHPSGGFSFDSAWHHHKMNNPHHPEYWYDIQRNGEYKLLSMPTIYIIEMVADWIGAGRVYGGDINEWVPKNIDSFNFHPKTKQELLLILDIAGIRYK